MALNFDSDSNGFGVADLAALLGAGNRGGSGFGGDGIYGLITLLVALSFFGGGFGGFGGGGIMPWLMMLMMGNNGGGSTVLLPAGTGTPGGNGCSGCTDAIQRTADQAATMTAITSVGNNVTGGFANAEIAAGARQLSTVQQLNNNQLSTIQQLFGLQTTLDGHLDNLSAALAQCCCDNRAATQDVKYTVATDGAQTRLAISDGVQKIMDKLCNLELDGVKNQLAAALAEVASLKADRSTAAQNSYIQSLLVTLAQYVRPPINPAFIVNPPYSTPTTDTGTATTAA